MIAPTHYLLLSASLFVIGMAVVITRRHALIALLGVELMLQAVNLALVALSSWFQTWSGEITILVVMTVAAVELTVGLGTALAYGRNVPTIGRPRS